MDYNIENTDNEIIEQALDNTSPETAKETADGEEWVATRESREHHRHHGDGSSGNKYRIRKRRRKFVHANSKTMRKLMYIWLWLMVFILLFLGLWYYLRPSTPSYEDLKPGEMKDLNPVISNNQSTNSTVSGAIKFEDLPFAK